MTMGMVERVARAIAKAGNAEWIGDVYSTAPEGERGDAFLSGIHSCREIARAAIEAMREPSEAMLGGEFVDATGKLWTLSDDGFKLVWQHMIAAALAEG